MEKKRELGRRDDVDVLIAGTVLTHLSGMSARCSRATCRSSATLTRSWISSGGVQQRVR